MEQNTFRYSHHDGEFQALQDSHDRLLAAVVDWHSPYDTLNAELIKRCDVATRRRIHRSRDAITQAKSLQRA